MDPVGSRASLHSAHVRTHTFTQAHTHTQIRTHTYAHTYTHSSHQAVQSTLTNTSQIRTKHQRLPEGETVSTVVTQSSLSLISLSLSLLSLSLSVSLSLSLSLPLPLSLFPSLFPDFLSVCCSPDIHIANVKEMLSACAYTFAFVCEFASVCARAHERACVHGVCVFVCVCVCVGVCCAPRMLMQELPGRTIERKRL